MGENEILYTSYNPVQALSIDDIGKLLYRKDRDLRALNLKALGDIVTNVEKSTSLPEQYLDSLEFLPGETADIEQYKNRIGEIVGSEWNPKNSPAMLSQFISDFGKAIGPNGDIGKAVQRKELYDAWLLDPKTQEAMLTLSNTDNEFLEKEKKDKLLQAKDTTSMLNIAAGDKVAKMPDFNVILSNKAMESIAEIEDSTIKEGLIFSTGLRRKSAVDIINGIIESDGDIKNWLEQYNRIHKKSYNLLNCIESYNDVDGGDCVIKEDLPDELKGAIKDAWRRATEYSYSDKPLKGSGGGSGNSYGGGGYNPKDSKQPTLVKTVTFAMPQTTSASTVPEIFRKKGVTSQKKMFIEQVNKLNGTGYNVNVDNATIYNTDLADAFGIKKYANGKESDSGVYNKSDIDSKTERIEKRYDGKQYIWYASDTKKSVYSSSTDLSDDYVKKHIRSVLYTIMNNQIRQTNHIDYISEVNVNPISKSSKDWLESNDFDCILYNENGNYCYNSDDKSKYNIGNIESISGYSIGTKQGSIVLYGKVKDGDTYIDASFALNNKNKLSSTCQWLYTHLTDDDKNGWGGFFLSNPEWINMLSSLQSGMLYRDNNDNLFLEYEFNTENIQRDGVKYIPAAFYGSKLRLTFIDNDNDISESYSIIGRDGKPAADMFAKSPAEFCMALSEYVDRFENPKTMHENTDMSGFVDDRIYGYDTDFDTLKKGNQSYFPQRNLSYVTTNDLTGEIRGLYDYRKYGKGSFNSGLFIQKDSSNKGIPINLSKHEQVHAGDFMGFTINGKNVLYKIVSYGNGYVLMDDKYRFVRELRPQDIQNTENIFIKAKENHRGEVISNIW